MPRETSKKFDTFLRRLFPLYTAVATPRPPPIPPPRAPALRGSAAAALREQDKMLVLAGGGCAALRAPPPKVAMASNVDFGIRSCVDGIR